MRTLLGISTAVTMISLMRILCVTTLPRYVCNNLVHIYIDGFHSIFHHRNWRAKSHVMWITILACSRVWAYYHDNV